MGAELIHEEVIWRPDPAAGSRSGQGAVHDLGVPVVVEVTGVKGRGIGPGPVWEVTGCKTNQQGLYVLQLRKRKERGTRLVIQFEPNESFPKQKAIHKDGVS